MAAIDQLWPWIIGGGWGYFATAIGGYLFHKFRIHFKEVDSLKQGLAKFGEKLAEIEKNIASILAIISGPRSDLATNQSPLSLTKRGKEIGGSIDAKNIADKHIEKYKEAYTDWEDMNAYHIQQTCVDFAMNELADLLTDQEKKPLEDAAYQHGIDLLSIFWVIGIVMRDKVLKERRIDLGEVDKHDPEQP